MNVAPTIAAAALLFACSPSREGQEENAIGNVAEAAAPAPTAPTAKAFVFDEKNDLVDFHFAWSAEAAAVPQLVMRFQADMEKAKAELLKGAKDEKTWREKEKLDFNGFMSSTDYKTAGQSPRILSLSMDVGNYTGGAHGNYGSGTLLWDRQAGREVAFKDLFGEPENRDRLLTQPWCSALNLARQEKRGEAVGGGGMFDDCPKMDDIAVVPTDKDGDGRFERLHLTASPYVAGPYAEGSYEIELPVTADLVATLKAEYRDSFEAAQPQ